MNVRDEKLMDTLNKKGLKSIYKIDCALRCISYSRMFR